MTKKINLDQARADCDATYLAYSQALESISPLLAARNSADKALDKAITKHYLADPPALTSADDVLVAMRDAYDNRAASNYIDAWITSFEPRLSNGLFYDTDTEMPVPQVSLRRGERDLAPLASAITSLVAVIAAGRGEVSISISVHDCNAYASRLLVVAADGSSARVESMRYSSMTVLVTETDLTTALAYVADNLYNVEADGSYVKRESDDYADSY